MKQFIALLGSIIFFTSIHSSSFSQQKMGLIEASQQLLELQKNNKSAESIIALFSAISLEDIQQEVKTNDEKLAFWINVYNGFIQYTLKKNPELYEDRRSFFSEKRIKIAGEVLSFADIEHGIIRKSQSPIGLGYIRRWFRPSWERKLRVNKRNWRVHFALNCGAKSCPPVAIYDPTVLDKQFDFMTTTYLMEQTTFDSQTKVAKSVSLFSWFRGDFGGKKGARKILFNYKITPVKPKKVEFTTYDWTLLLDNYREIELLN